MSLTASRPLNAEQSSKALHVAIPLSSAPDTSRDAMMELCQAFAQATDLDVVAHGMWSYSELFEGLELGQIHVAWMPPVVALHAARRDTMVPLALPLRHGVSSYSTALFTRPDSSIRQLSDLQGCKAAWVDKESASGYLVIRGLLRTRGVKLRDAFEENRFYGAHDAVVSAVLEGDADVGATFAYFESSAQDEESTKSAGWGDRQVHVIVSGGPIPSDMIVASKKTTENLRKKVSTALVSERSAPLRRVFGTLIDAQGFVTTSPKHLVLLATVLGGLREDEVPLPASLPPPALR